MRYPRFAKKSETAATDTQSPAKAAPDRLRIGQANDSCEREAERVASHVMAGGIANRDWSFSRMSVGTPGSSGGDREAGKAKETLQRKSEGAAETGIAPAAVHDVLGSPGQPLDAATRNFFEPRFGHDLSNVRVHTGERAAESARSVQAEAYTVGHDVVLDSGHAPGGAGDRRLLAHELVHTVQQERGGVTALQRQPAPAPAPAATPAAAVPEMKLVDDFAAKFPAAASLIKTNPAAMKLIKEAFDAGALFGGFAEDGPSGAIGRAYTLGHTVYIPRVHIDPPVMAMRDFLFELNNAIHQPRFTALEAAAATGAKTDAVAAKKYAYDNVEAEVEGMLRLGEVWFETKAKYLGRKAHDFDQYDRQFYLAEYKSFKDHQKTKDDIVKDVLARTYETGTLAGKTTEQFYIEQYQGLAK
jgi:hypothetical protein